jgi:hypothetical protein
MHLLVRPLRERLQFRLHPLVLERLLAMRLRQR